MPLPALLDGRLAVPAIAAPMFLVSGPDLVVETCKAGVVGSFPALNQRDSAGYAAWLEEIGTRLADAPGAAPFAANLIVHRTNPRLDADLAITVMHRVPLVITSLGTAEEVVAAVHSYGGFVLHDVINMRHAEKAVAAGVDGLVAVAAGAGGHAGSINPFALVAELRTIFSGTIALSGSINTGAQIAAARLMGADLGYLGTRFIATRESLAQEGYKQALVEGRAADIVYTAAVSGVPANFIRGSVEAAGIDAGSVAVGEKPERKPRDARAWRDIWSAGHGIGGIADIPGAGELCRKLAGEYRAALERIAAEAGAWTSR